MKEYAKQAREKMEAAGIKVLANPKGGFDAFNVPNCDCCWAATEDYAWAQAWGFFNLDKADA
jgi:hypothetical protein